MGALATTRDYSFSRVVASVSQQQVPSIYYLATLGGWHDRGEGANSSLEAPHPFRCLREAAGAPGGREPTQRYGRRREFRPALHRRRWFYPYQGADVKLRLSRTRDPTAHSVVLPPAVRAQRRGFLLGPYVQVVRAMPLTGDEAYEDWANQRFPDPHDICPECGAGEMKLRQTCMGLELHCSDESCIFVVKNPGGCCVCDTTGKVSGLSENWCPACESTCSAMLLTPWMDDYFTCWQCEYDQIEATCDGCGRWCWCYIDRDWYSGNYCLPCWEDYNVAGRPAPWAATDPSPSWSRSTAGAANAETSNAERNKRCVAALQRDFPSYCSHHLYFRHVRGRKDACSYGDEQKCDRGSHLLPDGFNPTMYREC